MEAQRVSEAMAASSEAQGFCVVPRDTKPAAEANIGHMALRGAAIGFVIVAALMTCVGFAFGLGPRSALMMGAFAGFWGGLGLGGMTGGVVSMREWG